MEKYKEKLDNIFSVQDYDSKRRKTGHPTGPMDKAANVTTGISINPDDLPEYDKDHVARFPEKTSVSHKG